MAKSGLKKDDPADKKGGGGGWWGSIFGGDKAEAREEGDVAIEDLTASFEEAAESRKARPRCLVSVYRAVGFAFRRGKETC